LKEESRLGYLSGFFAFLFWGFVPLYWKQIQVIPAFEIMSFRIVSAFLIIMFVLALRKELTETKYLLKNHFLMILLSSFLVGCNWLVYVWAVNSGHIIETSLGYFINPLLNIFLGVIFLGERPRKWQWVAITLAFVGVSFLAMQNVGSPWISLAVAGSFALYGFVRKKLNAKSLSCLGAESLILLPLAFIYFSFAMTQNSLHIFQQSKWIASLMLLSGIMTILPLTAFGYAVKHLHLTTLGLIQYLAPTFQLLIGVYIYNESFTYAHKITFSFIWFALFLYSFEKIYDKYKPKNT
jgi:chloramphenicol-sensitive protein RarD